MSHSPDRLVPDPRNPEWVIDFNIGAVKPFRTETGFWMGAIDKGLAFAGQIAEVVWGLIIWAVVAGKKR